VAQNTSVPKAPLYMDQMAISTTSVTGIRVARSALRGRRYLVFISTADVNIKFGTLGVAAATSSDELFKANAQSRVVIESGTTHFSVLGAGTGTFSWYLEGANGLDSAAGILGSLYVDEWTRDSGAGPTVWASRAGRLITNTGTITYAADNTNFNGEKVIGTALGASSMSATVTSLAPSGSTPYIAAVARNTNPGGTQILFCTGITNDQLMVFTVGGNFTGRLTGGAANVTGPAIDSAVHFFELWADGANLNFAVDGVLFQSATASKITENLTKFVVGDLITTPGSAQMAGSHSRYIFASNVPSAAQRAQLLAMAKTVDSF
jgi:hypothetical protein